MRCSIVLLSILLCFVNPPSIRAQQVLGPTAPPSILSDTLQQPLELHLTAWETYLADAVESGQLGEEEAHETYEMLCDMAESPLDLNQLTLADLQRIPFLNEFQRRHFLLYRHGLHRGFEDLSQIKEIPGWDAQTIELVWPLLAAKRQEQKLSLRQLLSRGKSEFALGYDRALQSKAGYSDTVTAPYRGKPFRTSIRARHKYSDDLSLGFSAEKDRGEPFFDKQIRGYDSYSMHLLLRQRGPIETLVLGDYKLSMGYGLAINQGSFMGLGYSQGRAGNRLRQHYSTAEGYSLRGAATTLRADRWSLTTFVAHDRVDASINSQGLITSLSQTGMHRSDSELRRRRAATMNSYGLSAEYSSNRFLFGINLLQYNWAKRRLLKATGATDHVSLRQLDRFGHLTIHYEYLYGQGEWRLFGESARASNAALATINGMELNTARWGRYFFVQRYMAAHYWSYYGGALAHYSRPGNEWGFFLRGEWQLPFRLQLLAYADRYGSPEPRYGRKEKSDALSLNGELQYRATRSLNFALRYRHNSERNYLNNRSLRLRVRYQITSGWNALLQGQISSDKRFDSDATAWKSPLHGKSMGLRVDREGLGLLSKASLSLSLFDADNYYNRHYISEANVPYAYPTSFVYGKGVRLGFYLRSKLGERWQLEAKLRHEIQSDALHIGSGNEQIAGNRLSELFLLLRYRISYK